MTHLPPLFPMNLVVQLALISNSDAAHRISKILQHHDLEAFVIFLTIRDCYLTVPEFHPYITTSLVRIKLYLFGLVLC